MCLCDAVVHVSALKRRAGLCVIQRVVVMVDFVVCACRLSVHVVFCTVRCKTDKVDPKAVALIKRVGACLFAGDVDASAVSRVT